MGATNAQVVRSLVFESSPGKDRLLVFSTIQGNRLPFVRGAQNTEVKKHAASSVGVWVKRRFLATTSHVLYLVDAVTVYIANGSIDRHTRI